MSSLKSPLMGQYQAMSMSNNSQAPPSPPRHMGFVSCQDSNVMNGFVGQKPAEKEEGGRPQQRKQMTSLASPDPMLSQQAFTQSQFTQNVSQGAQQPRNDKDQRLENLRRYTESQGGRYSTGRGSAVCPSPLFQQFNGRRTVDEQSPSTPPFQSTQTNSSPLQTVLSSEPVSYLSFILSDPNFMYVTSLLIT